MKFRDGFVSNSSSSSFVVFSSLSARELTDVVKRAFENIEDLRFDKGNVILFPNLSKANKDRFESEIDSACSNAMYSFKESLEREPYFQQLYFDSYDSTVFDLDEEVKTSLREDIAIQKDRKISEKDRCAALSKKWADQNDFVGRVRERVFEKFNTMYTIEMSDDGSRGSDLEHEILPHVWYGLKSTMKKIDPTAELFILSHH